jgi:hypothetical protein
MNTSLSFAMLISAVLVFGCGRDEDKNAESKDAAVSTSDPSAEPDVIAGEERAPGTSISPANDKKVEADTVTRLGQMLDLSIITLQELASLITGVINEQTAKASAPQITDKVATLMTINQQTAELGINEEKGREHFPEKYEQLKQMSSLLQGHMQRVAVDLAAYRVVEEAWKEGQSGEPRPLELGDEAPDTDDDSASKVPLPGEQPAQPTVTDKRRLRQYDPSQFSMGGAAIGGSHSVAMEYEQCLAYTEQMVGQMNADPSNIKRIVHTADTTMTQICMPHGNVLITCSKKTGQMSMTKVPPQSSTGC